MPVLHVRECREGSSASDESRIGTTCELKTINTHSSQNDQTRSEVAQEVTEAAPDAFGNEAGAEIQYKTMEWWHCGILMIAENISLGVLALPQAVAWLGFVPGLLLILFLGILAGYTGYIIGQFKRAYPQVVSYADCGELMFGPIGMLTLAVGQVFLLLFIMAAHILSFAIAMNVLTDHKMCTVGFSAIGLVVCFVLGLPRTLKGVSYLSIFSCISVFVAVIIAMIGIGVSRPDKGNVVAVQDNMSFVTGLTPVMNIVLAYAGHVGFFNFCAELRDPKDYPKALAFMQTMAITFYMVIATVIYFYAGPLVASPALASASPTVRKVAFGVALPTIIVAGVVNGSILCKYIYIASWKGTDAIHKKNFRSIGSWVAICAMAWFVSWLIAESIPNFNSMLAFIGGLFASWFSFALPAFLWLYMNWKRSMLLSTSRKTALTVLNCTILLLGVAMCVLGLWNSADGFKHGSSGEPFSCANNWKPSAGY